MVDAARPSRPRQQPTSTTIRHQPSDFVRALPGDPFRPAVMIAPDEAPGT